MFEKRVLELGDKTIHLYGVAHIADNNLYNSLNGLLEEDYFGKNFTVHHEGVRLSEKTTKTLRGSYSSLAQLFGVSEQSKPTVPFITYDLTQKDMSLRVKMQFKLFLALLKFGVKILKTIKEKYPEDFKNLDLEASKSSNTIDDSKTFLTSLAPDLYKFLLEDRNNYAISKALEQHGDVSLVWGKAHLDGMEDILVKKGFKVVSTENIVV